MGVFVKKQQCPKCAKNGRDRDRDNLAVYEDGSCHCFACGYTVKSKQDEEEDIQYLLEEVVDLITEQEHEEFKKHSTTDGRNFRGIRDETYRAFGVRHTYNPDNGEMISQFYPCTIGYKLSGYKCRKLPKQFGTPIKLVENGVGQECDLFGQFKFKNSPSKYVLIVGGEIDQLSAFQMLYDDVKARGKDYGPVPVVSSILGENGTYKQLKSQYEWLNRFERIVLCLDNDEAGKKATEQCVKVLPKGKVFVMDMEFKDPNEYLTAGKERQFVSAFYGAKLYTPSGIVGSDSMFKEMQNRAVTPKVKLPPFLKIAQKMLSGGFSLKQIINIVAGTSIGKTTLVNSMVKDWIFNSPYKVGVVTLEADVPEYGNLLLSEHIGRKLALIEDPLELSAYLRQPEVEQAARELFLNEDGTPRFYLIDDRGDFDSLQKKIEELIIKCDVQLIVIDPLSDALAGMPPDEQELFMKWMKQTIKRYDVLFVNIVHIRKAVAGQRDAGRGADLDESQMFGSSSLAKSAHVNMLLARDKYAEDEIERNSTRVTLAKNRSTGLTGKAGEIYYDNKTHRLWDKEDWYKKQGGGF